MKIQKLNKIENCRSFKKFLWSNANLTDFADYNLIYGWNGTGKTTLSEIFRAIERRKTDFDGDVTFENSNGSQISISSIADGSWSANIPSVRVFNKNYINDNIFETVDGDITPIFFLGEENVEKQKEVEKLKLLLNGSDQEKGVEVKFAETETEKKQTQTRINRFCSDGAKHIKDTLRSSGKNKYNNYDVRDYKKTAKEISQGEYIDNLVLKDNDKNTLIEKTKTSPKETLDLEEHQIPDVQSIYNSVKSLCAKTITSEIIQALSQDKVLSDWVHAGLELYKDHSYQTCQFCNQPLPETRVPELEKHFNDEYDNLIRQIDDQLSELQGALEYLRKIPFPKQQDLDITLQESFQEKLSAFNIKKNSLLSSLESLQTLLTEKRNKPFIAMSCDIPAPSVVHEEISQIMSVIRSHNEGIENHNSIIEGARSKIERSIIADSYSSYYELTQQYDSLEEQEKTLKKQVSDAKADIVRIEKEIKEHRKPAEQINEDLASYLGHEELKFETKENGYSISRFGFPAEHLSEGEKTAIALLYFLKSLEDTNFDIKNGIVVIDDPVSSMDDSALFYAFGFIKEKTKNVSQLFLLTHNFMFFRQVNNWFRHLKSRTKISTCYYQTFVTEEDGARKSGIKITDKLLTTHESEYHYLFSIIFKNSSVINNNNSLKEYYHLPNVARRVLECFLAFKYPSKDHSKRLYHMLNETSFDQSKKTRIGRFLDVHSHENHIGSHEHDPSILSETPAILTDILALIKAEDIKHYEEMVSLTETKEPAVKLVSNG